MVNDVPSAGQDAGSAAAAAPQAAGLRLGPVGLVRVAVTGVLMGIANLIPGVSGGTMVLAMGLYREFIDSVADVTALRFSVRRIVFLGVLGFFALAAIVLLAGVILYLLFHFPVEMYALFIGLTMGGAPTLIRSLRPVRSGAIVACVAGLLLMVGVWSLRAGVGFPHNTVMDVVSGVVGATTMVLPGVSGSYMLLLMDQYERVIGSIKDRDFLIIVPVGLGAIAGVVGLSHLLKFLLHRYPRVTVGVLLGILLGSILGLWPFDRAPGEKALDQRTPAELRRFAERWQIAGVADLPDDELAEAILAGWDGRGRTSYTAGSIVGAAVLAALGFVSTWSLARLQAAREDRMSKVS